MNTLIFALALVGQTEGLSKFTSTAWFIKEGDGAFVITFHPHDLKKMDSGRAWIRYIDTRGMRAWKGIYFIDSGADLKGDVMIKINARTKYEGTVIGDDPKWKQDDEYSGDLVTWVGIRFKNTGKMPEDKFRAFVFGFQSKDTSPRSPIRTKKYRTLDPQAPEGLLGVKLYFSKPPGFKSPYDVISDLLEKKRK